jgi:hypothetical protein
MDEDAPSFDEIAKEVSYYYATVVERKKRRAEVFHY